MIIRFANGGETVIDDSDAALAAQYKWHRAWNGYVKSSLYTADRSIKTVYLHRVLMSPPAGMVVDHIDGDRLNNRRANLRVCTRSQNGSNRKRVEGTSGYRGVSHHKQSGRWHAELVAHGKRIFIGSFRTREEAALAYNRVAVEQHGEFAQLNAVG